ncbi:CoiA-like domain protein [Rhizobium leguminosarum bv. viciae]|nr:CoiA-like domain protein [Rhizobium leguminosarum bv. viciae]TBZ70218.1 CoiA-like domain protein [Rhizobium leguminosarum bv. viciae]TBZ89810.1 CoiA-like domain protein [Rhizobium leguminosarum bv. viciae]
MEEILQFALVENQRSEARPGLKGFCAICGAAMVSKCGPRVIHHWAHASRLECDPWWENETEWHREWKNRFPAECREQTRTAPDGEIHRADIVTPTGIVIEVQHSAMTDVERQSREVFYQNLVWIVDGRGFRKQFDLHHLLPDPDNDEAHDLVWFKAARGMHGANSGVFWRRSENPNHEPGEMVFVHGANEIDHLIATCRGHQQYSWVKPRTTWLDAQCPVYIDFGDEWLFQLQRYGFNNLQCVYRVSKEKFLHDGMTETQARDIATRFYPIA